MKTEKRIPVLSIILVIIFFIALCSYWFYRFYIFKPVEGTSTASISALWGQFLVSFLLVAIISAFIIFIDRRHDIKFYKLFSFWLIILSIVTTAGYFMYRDIDRGATETHVLGEAFDYNHLEYKLTKSNEDLVYTPNDCSQYTNSGRVFSNSRDRCEEGNSTRKKESEESTLLVIIIDVTNKSSSPQDIICKDCLVLRNPNGEIIDQKWSFESQAFSNQIFPGNSLQLKAQYKVRKEELKNTYYLTFSTNKAPQYVEIK